MRILLILIFIPCVGQIQAQDTLVFNKQEVIFVYDTVVVYDTIRLSSISEFKILKSQITDSGNLISDRSNYHSTVLKNYFPQPATISSYGIITDENQNELKMKKRNFLGGLLFAITSFAQAQDDWGWNAGMTFPASLETLQGGVFYQKDLNTMFRFQSGVQVSTIPAIQVPAKFYYDWNGLTILGGVELWHQWEYAKPFQLALAIGLQLPIDNYSAIEFSVTEFGEEGPRFSDNRTIFSLRFQRKFKKKKSN